MKPRIELSDSIMDTLVKMSEGNPGALNVCMAIMKGASKIDPDSAFGPLGVFMQLDMLGVYDSRIWMLYKDVCGQDLPKMLAVLRANQLGFSTDAQVNAAIANYGEGLDLDALCKQVGEMLPSFNFKA